MDTTTTQSALDALRTAEFRLSLRGYDVDEVDDFLERAAVEADQLKEQVRTTSAQATQAAERLRHLETTERTTGPAPAAPPVADVATKAVAAGATTGTVTKMIEMAERFVEQTRLDAEAEAARIVADAQDRARQLATDAQQRLADEVARLEGLRQRLGEDVEKMSTQLESERMRLSGSLHDLLGWIDKNLQPAAALAALRASAVNGVAPTNGPASPQSNSGAQVLSIDDARREV
ncbi:MAG TPA: DivIVA domain-containing protein [Acidimicrobiales bacterium]|nr:DivIVA domain-containing protein [Acidimicrobiales bacterium]